MNIDLKEERLNNRWLILVRSQMKSASALAAGVGVLPTPTARSFSAPQAAYRFYNNDSDIGYELTTSLAISADDGSPLAPVEVHMKTGDAFLSTRPKALAASHLDLMLPTMRASASWILGRPIVNMVDREADSVGHWRQWVADGHLLLIRGDDRVVRWEDHSIKLSDIQKELKRRDAFRDVGPALYHGRAARLLVTETAPAVELKTAPTLLSGRQMKRSKPFTAPTLLAGLWSLLAMLDTLEHYDIPALHALINKLKLPIPLLKTGSLCRDQWACPGGEMADRLPVPLPAIPRSPAT